MWGSADRGDTYHENTSLTLDTHQELKRGSSLSEISTELLVDQKSTPLSERSITTIPLAVSARLPCRLSDDFVSLWYFTEVLEDTGKHKLA